jgi:hypothetical protein
LQGAGFIEPGANPIAIAMEQGPEELYPEIGLDKDHYKHRYLLVTFEEKNKKQRKLHWYVGTSDLNGSFLGTPRSLTT